MSDETPLPQPASMPQPARTDAARTDAARTEPTRTFRRRVTADDASTKEIVAVVRPARWYAVIWSSRKARVGIVMLAVFLLVAVFADFLSPYRPNDATFAPSEDPSWAHWMGTNTLGYDIWTQLVHGTRLSFAIGVLGGLATIVIAIVVGLLAGYREGGLLDDILSFLTNLALVIPVLPLMMVIVAYSETRGLGLLVFVIAITSWAGASREMRSLIISMRNRDYVTAARFGGDGMLRIVFREIMPNMSSLIVSGFIGAATAAIAAEAGLSFMGFGDPNTVSWGQMLAQANANGALVQGLWVWLVAPGVMLALLMTSLTFVNFGVDMLSNPHLREEEKS